MMRPVLLLFSAGCSRVINVHLTRILVKLRSRSASINSSVRVEPYTRLLNLKMTAISPLRVSDTSQTSANGCCSRYAFAVNADKNITQYASQLWTMHLDTSSHA